MDNYTHEATYLIRHVVLAITKRSAELCTLSLPYQAELVTATNMVAAQCVLRAIAVRGVYICRDSWSEQERESILSELAVEHPELTIIMRCAKCKPGARAKTLPGFKVDREPSVQSTPPATTRIVCSDCGKEFPYQPMQMKWAGAEKHDHRCA